MRLRPYNGQNRGRNRGLKADEKLHMEPIIIYVEKTIRPKYAGLKSDAAIAKGPETKTSPQ